MTPSHLSQVPASFNQGYAAKERQAGQDPHAADLVTDVTLEPWIFAGAKLLVVLSSQNGLFHVEKPVSGMQAVGERTLQHYNHGGSRQ